MDGWMTGSRIKGRREQIFTSPCPPCSAVQSVFKPIVLPSVFPPVDSSENFFHRGGTDTFDPTAILDHHQACQICLRSVCLSICLGIFPIPSVRRLFQRVSQSLPPPSSHPFSLSSHLYITPILPLRFSFCSFFNSIHFFFLTDQLDPHWGYLISGQTQCFRQPAVNIGRDRDRDRERERERKKHQFKGQLRRRIQFISKL